MSEMSKKWGGGGGSPTSFWKEHARKLRTPKKKTCISPASFNGLRSKLAMQDISIYILDIILG